WALAARARRRARSSRAAVEERPPSHRSLARPRARARARRARWQGAGRGNGEACRRSLRRAGSPSYPRLYIMDAPPQKKLNFITLAVFAPVLILTGALGFVLPPGPMGAAPAYNVFHILFGVLGGGFVLGRRASLIRTFNIGFGFIDLYQALASF